MALTSAFLTGKIKVANHKVQICLAGATGLVGGQFLQLAQSVESISKIKAISRRPLKDVSNKVENLVFDFDELEKHEAHLKADIFVCALGSTIKAAGSQEAFRKVDYDYVVRFAKIAEKLQAQKFMVVSAMGASAESKVFYNRVKGEMEEALYDLEIPQIEVFRPSLILGQRKEARLGEDIAKALTPVMNLFMQGPLKKYRPIEANDIAQAMLIAAAHLNPGRYVYESDEIQRIAEASR